MILERILQLDQVLILVQMLPTFPAVTLHQRDRMSKKMDHDFVHDIRPWGDFKQYVLNKECTVKIITVNPGERLSLQRHSNRDEMWVALDKGLEMYLGSEEGNKTTMRMQPWCSVRYFIERGWYHCVTNVGDTPARFLEIAFGHFDEDDIERIDDKYGRS